MEEIVKPTELSQNLISRKVIQRTRGVSHGPIVRLMSPSDLGERLKPFVFLDRFESDMRQMARSMPVHRHSGIGTITVFADGISYDLHQSLQVAKDRGCISDAVFCGTISTNECQVKGRW